MTAFWPTELVLVTRVLISDYVQPYTYSDARIQEVLIIAGMLCQLEVDLLHSPYTFDVANLIMTPDPANASIGKDYGACCLFSLKAACILQLSSFRDKARNAGIQVRSDRELIDTKGQLDGDKFLLNSEHDVSADYKNALWEYKAGNYSAGYAILTGFSSPNLSTSNPGIYVDYNSILYPYNNGASILDK